ncbi:unnamed protein product [Dibothriocephalus latus]|uniref:Uncharacterized protein n=1 Tax=Dibothriocephalus latus TaxID=60516 RepID=A0A3P6TYN5_DIBLA|nr:unnamed protein product [Dibothriocephalus latus]
MRPPRCPLRVLSRLLLAAHLLQHLPPVLFGLSQRPFRPSLQLPILLVILLLLRFQLLYPALTRLPQSFTPFHRLSLLLLPRTRLISRRPKA